MTAAMRRKASASSSAQEKRSSPRLLTFRTGQIVSLQKDKNILAAILDLSQGGACLLVSDIDDVPDRFQFFADCGSETFCCEVRWKSGHRIGVRFT